MSRSEQTTKEPVRVAIYVRVSSEDQRKEHYSIDTQIAKCREKLDDVIGPDLYIAEIFRDEGIPGRYGLYDPSNPRRKYRPDLTRMQQAFKDGQLDVLCIYRSNRFWRKAAMGEFIKDEFVPYGLKRIISCTEHIDFSTASGRFQLNIAAAVGAYEAEQLGEWISDALQKRMRDGYAMGWSYGWHRIDKRADGNARPSFRPDPEQGPVVRDLADSYLRGEAIASLTRRLNAMGIPPPRRAKTWTRSTVRRVLLNPLHAGLVRIKNADGSVTLIEGEHHDHRLYDAETYYLIRARLEDQKPYDRQGTGSPDYLLRRRLTCAHCGKTMNGRRVLRRNCRVYRCAEGIHMNIPECIRNSQRAELVEAVIVDKLRRIAQRPEVVRGGRSHIEKTLAEEGTRLKHQVRTLTKRSEELWEEYRFWSSRFRSGRCEQAEFDFHVNEFRRAKQQVEETLKSAEEELAKRDMRAAVLARAQEIIIDFDKSWDGLSMEQRGDALLAVLEGNVTMGRLPDGRTEVRFQIRGWEPVARHIAQFNVPDRSPTGVGGLTPRMQLYLYWWGQGLDRQGIADKCGVSKDTVHAMLWKARTTLRADTLDEAWEAAREDIEPNLPWLLQFPKKRRLRDVPARTQAPTKTELALLTRMAAGKTVKEAAGELGMATDTAYVHLKNARTRLAAASNEDLVRKAADLGYVPVPVRVTNPQ